MNYTIVTETATLVSQLHKVEHSLYLVLIVDIGSCLQQSLDYLGVSLPSSYPQRITAMLYMSSLGQGGSRSCNHLAMPWAVLNFSPPSLIQYKTTIVLHGQAHVSFTNNWLWLCLVHTMCFLVPSSIQYRTGSVLIHPQYKR